MTAFPLIWTQAGGTGVTLSDPTSFQPTFKAPDVGPEGAVLTFDLTVTDTGGLYHSFLQGSAISPLFITQLWIFYSVLMLDRSTERKFRPL
ncbi:MAG: hypothetical protein R6W88_14010 [Desulfobacterales bacterium]